MTIKDIARESGCAISTVSRALNDHPDISAQTKNKIKAVVEHYGFVPNHNARQLKAQQIKCILILVKGAFNLFFAAILEQMQVQIAAAGYVAEVNYLDEDADELLEAQRLQREHKPLGFLFLGGNVRVFEQRFSIIKIPSVLATTISDTLHFPLLSCVGVDDMTAGADVCRALTEKGHRKIAVIGGNPEVSYISALRYKGFCAAYQKATGAAHAEKLYQKSAFNVESGYRAMQILLARAADITAVFCMSDITAIGAMRAIHDANLRVPQEISVFGFDGLQLGNFCTPRLATVCQPQREIAIRSVELLLAQIEHAAAAQTLTLPAPLREGESVRTLHT